MAGAATQAQRMMFNPTGDLLNYNSHMDAKSNRMRDAYNAAQRVFRDILKTRTPDVEDFNDHVSMLSNREQREGFMMGWQSDVYAYENNMQLSVVGGVRWNPEEENRRGYTTEYEGSSVLDESD